MWDAPHMTADEPTPLQVAIRAAVAESGKAREHFDRIVQRALGTTGKPIYDIDRGKVKRPSVETLAAIAQAFDKPLSYFVPEMAERGTSRSIPQVVRDAALALRQIDLGFSMGDGSNIDDYVEEGTIEFDANLLRSITRSPPDRLFVARGDGDSMFPTLINDDMVVIDTLQRQLNLQDRIWACSVHGAGAIKRLRTVGKGRIEVRSDNPTVGNTEVDAEDLVLLGRVVWVGRRL